MRWLRGGSMRAIEWLTKEKAALALLSCALLAGTLAAAGPDGVRRELARQAPSPSQTVCEGGTIAMDWESNNDPHTFVEMYIPAGATARFIGQGEILPSFYIYEGRGEYVMEVRVWNPATGTAIFDDWNFAGVSSNEVPYPWIPFGPRTLGEYKNNTGASRMFIIEFWARRSYAGADLRWDASAVIDDGVSTRSAICFPVDPSELIDCNPSMKNGCVRVDTADPVNTYSGAFHDDFVDIAPIPGRGPTAAVQRFYNTALSEDVGAFGPGWRHNLDLEVSGPNAEGLMTVTQENGTTVIFRDDGEGGWESPSRSDATLDPLPDGGWRFVRRDHQIFEFSSIGQLTKVRDLNGYELNLSYSSGLLDTVTDAAGRSITYTWIGSDADARITQLTDPSTPARTVSYGYDSSRRLTSVTDVAGGVWRYGYDPEDRIVTMTKPRQEQLTGQPSVVNSYDALGRVVTQTDEKNQTTLFDYTSEPNSTIVTDPELNKTKYLYDQYGLITSVTKGYQSATASTWTYTHDLDTFGVTSVVGPRGNVTKATYDGDGDRTSVTDPLKRTTTWTYNHLDQVVTHKDPAGVTTTYTYDAAGNPTTVSKPLYAPSTTTVIDTATTTLAYGDSAHPGDITAVTDPIGRTTHLAYDATGNLIQTTTPPTAAAPSGAVTTMAYNSIGWIESVVSPRGNLPGATSTEFRTTYARNAFGDIFTVTAPDGAVTTTAFDANRNVVSVTDPNENTTEYTYDLLDRPTTVSRPDGTTTQTSYTKTGMTATTSDAAGHVTSYSYDSQDRLTASTDPLDRTTNYRYDLAGNLTAKTSPGAVTTAFSYDTGDQLTSIDYPGGTNPDERFTYDSLGRKTSSTRDTGTVFGTGWGYDSLGRMTAENVSGARNTKYGYDLAGQLTSISYPDNAGTITRTYSGTGQLETVTDWHLRAFSFDYDADGNLIGQHTPNGTTTTIAVDNAGSVTDIAHAGAGGVAGAFAQFGYVRDANRQVTGLTESGVPKGADSYAYDPLNQLTSVTKGAAAGAYRYDKADNITRLLDQTSQTFDDANQLLSSTAPITYATSTAVTDQASKTLVVPYTAAAGDQALLWVTVPAGQSVTAIPPGFTALGSWAQGNTKAYLYRKTLTASTDATATIEFSGLAGNYTKSATAVVYRGVDPDEPIEDVQDAVATGSNVTVPSVDGTLGNTGHLLFTASHTPGIATTPGTWTTNPAMTSRVTAAPSLGVAATVFDQNIIEPGPTGAVTATNTVPGALVAVAVALKPDALTYGYDARGNRTSRSNGSGTTTYAYDGADRLTNIEGEATYTYNGDGLRVTKTVDGKLTKFAWSTNAALPLLIAEDDVYYVYGPGNRLLEAIDPAPDIEYVGGFNLALDDAPTYAVPMPLGVTKRDLILLTAVLPAGQTVDTPDGYTIVDDRTAGTVRTVIWKRIAGEEEPLAVTLNYSLGTYNKAAAIQLWRNIDTDNPIESVAATSALGGSTIASGTGTASNMWGNQAVLIGGLNATSDFTGLSSDWTVPNGIQQRPTTVSASSRVSLLMADGAVPNGTVGPYTVSNARTGDLTLTLLVLNHERPPGRYTHPDQLGSIRATTNEYAELTGTATYDPYGRSSVNIAGPSDGGSASGATTISVAGASLTVGGNQSGSSGASGSAGGVSGFGFAGEYSDAESGFTYLRARYYDPATAQFLTRDPLEVVSRSPYGYGSNDPVNRIDPTGMIDIPGWVPVVGGMCVDIADPNCESPRDGHSTGLSRGVVNFAGGALDMNPIYRLVEAGIESVSDCDIDLASQGVDRSSGWYTTGQVSMVVVDVVSLTGWATGARFRFAVHDAHHTFGKLGKLPHLQWNFWRQGVKGSGFPIRIPLPKWFK
jgi:RHS repeat-associated protein